MENSIYVALSRQMILRCEMDVIANNIANADTAGFKVEAIISETKPEQLPQPAGGRNVLQFVLDTGVARDFSQGTMAQTGGPLDIGIDGDGFFQINADRGERFTRDGRFTTDATGRLVTQRGEPVAGDGGDIILDPARGQPSISPDGIVSQDGVRVGKLSVYRFASLSVLSKEGDGLYKNDGNQAPEAASDARLQQGAVESSNVQPVIEITRMIDVSREYERIAKLMDQAAQITNSAIERLGRVS